MNEILYQFGLDWSIEVLLLFLLLAFLAEVLGTVGGFGSSVFFVPVATMFMDFHDALGLTALFHVASNISKIYLFKKGVDKKIILQLGIPAVVAVIIGAFIAKYLDTELLEVYLGVLLIVISIFFLVKPHFKIRANTQNAVIGGIASGGLAGMLGTGGAIRGLTLTAFGLSKEVFIATSAVIDLGVDFSRSVVYSANGFVSFDTLKLLPFLIIIGFVGTYVGRMILRRIPQERFEKIVLILILLIGVQMFW